MASSKDFEKIWESYQEVIKTKDVSIVDSGVSIVPVSDSDVQTEPAPMIPTESSPSRHSSVHVKTKVNYVNIEFSNGLKVCQKSMSYEHLKLLVEKLEVLC